jgi:hypothetical protein
MYFFYLKYLIGSIRSLVKHENKNEMSQNDLIEIFTPYIETNSKFDRILTSKSYFAHLVANFEYYFNRNEDDCQGNSHKYSNKAMSNFSTKNANDKYYTTIKTKASKETGYTQTKNKMMDKFKIKKKATSTVEPVKELQDESDF